MTVSSIIPVNNYAGNGSNTKFDFDFLIEDSKELVVTHISQNGTKTVLTNGIDYSINEIGNKNGSFITFPVLGSSFNTLQTDETISLCLDLEIKQESEFENSSHLNLNVLEWTFDYLVRILQMLSRKIQRCIKVQEGLNFDTDELVENTNTLVNNLANINTAVTNISNINKVGNNISNVNTVANNMTDINSAPTHARNAGIWAEGTDEQVQELGGIHSAKNWVLSNEWLDSDLTTVTEKGLNTINQANVLETGSVENNPSIYGDILIYSHSTFDSSKFTLSGTPTISSDGEASGFSLDDYVNVPGLFNNSTTYTSVGWGFAFTYTQANPNQLAELRTSNNNNRITFFTNPVYDKATFQVVADGVTYSTSQASSVLNLTKTHKYFVYILVSTTTATVCLYDITAKILQQQSISSVLPLLNEYTNIRFGRAYAGNSYSGEKIDLKYTRIDANGLPLFKGNITKTDTVKINSVDTSVSYTLSKTGSKIVDAAYLTTIQNMYEEYGYAPYYTIDEVNANYTRPMGEIYGMMLNQATPHITETYQNGTSWYRIWSDGWCEQGGYEGFCNDDIVINLLKSYKDLNYNLSGTSATSGSINIGLIIKDETSFYYHIGNNNTSGFWQASGYMF